MWGRLALVLLLVTASMPSWAAGQTTPPQVTVSGTGVLALATLVAVNSPNASASDQTELAALLDANLSASFPAGQTITVTIRQLICAASNVDITAETCTLIFGPQIVRIRGRLAHELLTTMIQVGITPDGSVGRPQYDLSRMSCVIDPDAVKKKAGGGASCQFIPAII